MIFLFDSMQVVLLGLSWPSCYFWHNWSQLYSSSPLTTLHYLVIRQTLLNCYRHLLSILNRIWWRLSVRAFPPLTVYYTPLCNTQLPDIHLPFYTYDIICFFYTDDIICFFYTDDFIYLFLYLWYYTSFSILMILYIFFFTYDIICFFFYTNDTLYLFLY